MSVENWVILGDSLSEGVGFARISYVSELVRKMRVGSHSAIKQEIADGAVGTSLVRFRAVPRSERDRFIRFGYAADVDEEESSSGHQVWVWNLASEGTTVKADFSLIGLIHALQPTIAVVFRGSLEGIVRPEPVSTGRWPAWVPGVWRGYAAMDPRCYFSETPWRRAKQITVDWVRQRIRQLLLARGRGTPLLSRAEFETHTAGLLLALQQVVRRIIVCGLLPVDEGHFPGSDSELSARSEILRELALRMGCEFVDWGSDLRRVVDEAGIGTMFYRDGFHPNLQGAQVLADILWDRVVASDHAGVPPLD